MGASPRRIRPLLAWRSTWGWGSGRKRPGRGCPGKPSRLSEGILSFKQPELFGLDNATATEAPSKPLVKISGIPCSEFREPTPAGTSNSDHLGASVEVRGRMPATQSSGRGRKIDMLKRHEIEAPPPSRAHARGGSQARRRLAKQRAARCHFSPLS